MKSRKSTALAIADTVPHCLLDGVLEVWHVLDMSGSDHWVLSHHLLHLLPQFVLDIRIAGQGVHTPSHGRASLKVKDIEPSSINCYLQCLLQLVSSR